MLRCEACGAWQPDNCYRCETCAKGPVRDVPVQVVYGDKVNFVLDEVSHWIRWGWIGHDAGERIRAHYRPLWEKAHAIPTPAVPPPMRRSRPASDAPPPMRRSHPASDAPTVAESVAAPGPSPVSAFLEERNITYWHGVGGLLLLAGLTGLVRYTWSGAGRYLVFALLLVLTIGLHALAQSRPLRDFKIGRAVLGSVAALLLPLDIVAANAFHLFGWCAGANGIGAIASTASLAVYALLARREPGRTYAVFFSAAAIAAVHFLLQAAAARELSQAVLYALYGYAYAALCACMFCLASLTKDGPRREVFVYAGHTAVVVGLLASGSRGGNPELNLGGTLLAVASIYFGGAVAMDRRAFATISAIAMIAGSWILLLSIPPRDAGWIAYSAAAQMSAGLYCLARPALRNERYVAVRGQLSTASWYLFAAGQAVFAFGFLSGFGRFPAFRQTDPDALFSIASSAAAFLALRRLKSRVPANIALLAGGFIAMAFTCKILPGHYSPRAANAGLLLAAAALMGRAILKDRASAAVFAIASSCLSVLCLLTGSQEAAACAALAIVAAGLVIDLRDGAHSRVEEIQADVYWMLGIAVTLTWRAGLHIVPWLALHARIEPNYGLGYAALAAALFALRSPEIDEGRLRRTAAGQAIGRCAFLISGALAVYEIIHAGETGFRYSPALILEALTLAAAVDGAVRRSQAAATMALALHVTCYLAAIAALDQIGAGPGSSWLVAAVLLAGGCALAAAAGLLDRRDLALCATASIVLAYGHLVHQMLHVWGLPLAAWLAPVAGIACAAAHRRPAGDLWNWPLRFAANAVLAGVTVPAAYATVTPWGASSPGAAVFILSLGGFHAAALARIKRRAPYLAMSAVYLNAAAICALRHHSPAVPPNMTALYIGLIAPVWTAAAAAIKRRPAFGDGGDAVLRRTSGVVASMSCVTGWLGRITGFDHAWLATLLLAGCVFAAVRMAGGSGWWRHAAFAAFMAAYAAYLQSVFGPLSVRLGDVYLAPAGLYVITMAALARKRDRRDAYPPLFVAGMLLLMTPSLLAVVLIAGDIAHVLVLVTECVVAVWYGIAARVRSVAVTGTAFLVVLIGLQFHGYVTRIHWAVYATVLGLGIIASALILERKRADFLRLRKAVSEYWDSWD